LLRVKKRFFVIAITASLARGVVWLSYGLEEGSPMKQKIGLAFTAAAIGFAMIALAQASISLGHTHMQRASAGLAFQVLQPIY
jgi:hypothetical protein